MSRAVTRVCPLIAVAMSWLMLTAPGVLAEPLVDLSWDTCSPIVSAKEPVPGQPLSTLYCTISGMDQPHTGYQINLWFAAEMPCRTATSTPDAWRFDLGGCQGPSFGVIRTTTTSKTCPMLAGPLTPFAITDLRYSPDDSMTPSGAMRARVAVSYLDGVRTPDPAVRYQLFRIEMDHTYAVTGAGTPGETCGGFESPMCFALWSGTDTVMGECYGFFARTASSYLDAQGSEQFLRIGQGYASFGVGSGPFGCFEVTPARSTTWGAIKSQYH